MRDRDKKRLKEILQNSILIVEVLKNLHELLHFFKLL